MAGRRPRSGPRWRAIKAYGHRQQRWKALLQKRFLSPFPYAYSTGGFQPLSPPAPVVVMKRTAETAPSGAMRAMMRKVVGLP